MATPQGRTEEDTAGSAFERFWKRTGKRIANRTFTFVSQPEAETANTARTVTSNDDETTAEPGSDAEDKPSKRRQQIYNAQKRHRNRKHEYIRSLESELEKLRNMESMVTVQKDRLTQQNTHMRMLLDQHETRHGLNEATNYDATTTTTTPFATVTVDHDDTMGQERLFLQAHASQPAAQNEDTWLAMDFILALEWPCRTHIPHPIMSTPDKPYMSCGPAAFNAHALTTTSQIVGGSLHETRTPQDELPSHTDIDKEILKKWQIPYAEIQRLVKLAEDLMLDEDVITPAQAYAAIKAKCSATPSCQLESTLDFMKRLLASASHCEGFGAVVDTQLFHQHLDHALKQMV